MKQNSLFLARKYARAYDGAAKDSNQAAGNFAAYIEALNQLAAADVYILNPTLPFAVKEEILAKILHSNSAAGFIKLLVSSKRFYLADLISGELQNLLDARQGVTRLAVKSATVLNSEQKQKIEAALADFFKTKIAAHYSEDKTLLAGLTVQKGDTIIDASALGRIKDLTKILIGTGK